MNSSNHENGTSEKCQNREARIDIEYHPRECNRAQCYVKTPQTTNKCKSQCTQFENKHRRTFHAQSLANRCSRLRRESSRKPVGFIQKIRQTHKKWNHNSRPDYAYSNVSKPILHAIRTLLAFGYLCHSTQCVAIISSPHTQSKLAQLSVSYSLYLS